MRPGKYDKIVQDTIRKEVYSCTKLIESPLCVCVCKHGKVHFPEVTLETIFETMDRINNGMDKRPSLKKGRFIPNSVSFLFPRNTKFIR